MASKNGEKFDLAQELQLARTSLQHELNRRTYVVGIVRTRMRFCRRSGPTRRGLFRKVPINFDAPLGRVTPCRVCSRSTPEDA